MCRLFWLRALDDIVDKIRDTTSNEMRDVIFDVTLAFGVARNESNEQNNGTHDRPPTTESGIAHKKGKQRIVDKKLGLQCWHSTALALATSLALKLTFGALPVALADLKRKDTINL